MIRTFTCCALVVMAVLVSGCARIGSWIGQPGLGEEAFRQARMERLVADDFARILVQLEPVEPAVGPVILSPPRSAFGQSLKLAMRRAGYRIEIGTDLEHDRFLRYSVESIQNQFGTSRGYQVGLGEVVLSRDYSVKPNGVFPLSQLRVEGASSLALILDDDRFRRQDRNEIVVSGLTPDPRFDSERVLPGTPGGVPLMFNERGKTVVDKKRVIRENMYETRESSFGEYFDAFEPVSRQVLIFPNDSIRVVPDTQAALRELRADFNPDTDVFSVVGCSHGVTALPNGNEVLAEGRSRRVLEELVELGIPESQVLEEGCWAKQPFDKMPARGVVVELKRRKRS